MGLPFASVVLVVVTATAIWLLAVGDPDRVGVAGALLGGVVGFLAAWILEASRRGHEDAHRFEADRKALYARFLGAVADAEKITRSRGVEASVRRERPDLAHLIDMPDKPDTDPIGLMVDEIRLLAPFGVYASARVVEITLTSLDDAIDKPDADWQKASHSLYDARTRFLKRAKDDLGTPTGVMTRWQERRYRAKKRLNAMRPTKKPPTSE
jgi:hypothetical protein